MNVRKFIDDYLLPYVDKHYPNADIVLLAGSMGRSMKNGDFMPQSSSDADLIVIYKDLDTDGFKAATKIFRLEDTGAVAQSAGVPDKMMIDCNIHDLASLIYHCDQIKEYNGVPFMPVMVDEGFLIRDRLGIGAILQKQAKEYMAAGPTPPCRDEWRAEIDKIKTYVADIAAASTSEERRFIGLLAMTEMQNFNLMMNRTWINIGNQAYRTFARRFPEDGEKLTEAMTALIRTGDAQKFNALAGHLLARAEAFLETLQKEPKAPLPYTVDKHVPADERKSMDGIFFKFITEHLVTSFPKSATRGEMAFLENLGATVRFLSAYVQHEQGLGNPGEGRVAFAFIGKHIPDLIPAAFAALDDQEYAPAIKVADDVLKAMGGIHYDEIINYYAEDVARVNALDAGKTALKPSKAGYKLKK